MSKILIVDDSKTSRRILKGILEDAGHVIVGEASNGEEGCMMYESLKPDVVTMDITMPKMDGLEALEVIRHKDPEAKVIMITAAGQNNKVYAAVKEGAAEFITKPFDDSKILEAIDRVSKQ